MEGTGEIVETSPMGAIQLSDPFTDYVFVDKDPQAITALAQRVSRARPDVKGNFIVSDVNDAVPEIKRALPRFSKERGLISFCFVDPYAADLKFSTIRALSVFKMDFLILLMLGRDIRTNFKQYRDDPQNSRIADLIDSPKWREEWRDSGERSPVRFVLRKFDEAMTTLGYQPTRDELVHPVKIPTKNVFLYSLVLYSKHELAQAFWRETLTRTDPQLGFGI